MGEAAHDGRLIQGLYEMVETHLPLHATGELIVAKDFPKAREELHPGDARATRAA